MDYSNLRMKSDIDLNQYIEKMGRKEFFNYCEKLFNVVEKLGPGQSFKVDILVKEDNREMFIKILHCFVIDFDFKKYTFNNTFTEFRRYGKEETIQLESTRCNNKNRSGQQHQGDKNSRNARCSIV